MMRDPPGLNGRYGLASKQGDLLMEAWACRWQVFFTIALKAVIVCDRLAAPYAECHMLGNRSV